MSRAININASEADIMTMCAKHQAPVSCIEPLTSGGARVVLKTADSAAIITRAFGKKVIAGTVKRAPLRTARVARPEEAPLPQRRSRWED